MRIQYLNFNLIFEYVQRTNSSKSIKSKSDRILSRFYNCDMMDEDFLNEIGIDLSQWKKRNQQITKQIRKLLKKDPHKKYLFAVGAGQLSIQYLI